MFAASKCGAIYLPLNWRLAAREIEDVLKDAEPTILFVGDEFADRIKDLAGAVPGLKSIVALDRGGSTPHEPYADWLGRRSEEHTSELQSLMRISYAVFCLKKKTHITKLK